MKKFNIPRDIEQEAQDFMKEVIDLLDKNGVSETVDTGALIMLARNYSMFVKASKELQQGTLLILSDRGNFAPNPLIKIAKDAQTLAMKVMVEFGLTAKSRTKLPKMGNDDTESPLEVFVKGNKELR